MKRVLLIDDDPLIRSAYGRRLCMAGYHVQVSADGTDGLLALKGFDPHVVLLDLDMPGVNGIEWLREIRSYPKTRRLPVIVLSAGSHPWQMKAAWESDALYVLSKGMTDPQAVIDAIGDAVAAARPH